MKFIIKFFAVIQTLIVVGVAFSAQLAYAHGEKAQQPALRMRTVHWFDLELSTTKLEDRKSVV